MKNLIAAIAITLALIGGISTFIIYQQRQRENAAAQRAWNFMLAEEATCEDSAPSPHLQSSTPTEQAEAQLACHYEWQENVQEWARLYPRQAAELNNAMDNARRRDLEHR